MDIGRVTISNGGLGLNQPLSIYTAKIQYFAVGGGGSGWGVGGSVVTGTQAAGVYPPFPGYPNSGGGGGGGFKATGTTQPGTGGSGVFFIMYPELYPAATTTGSPTVSSINGYRVYTFTSSGSIVFS